MDRVGADLIVRPMRPSDLDVVSGIERASFSTPWHVQTFADLIGRSGVELLVLADADDQIVGYAVLWCVVDQGELANLAVAPERRGQGHGRRILGHALDVARARGLEKVFLEVRASNTRAAALYSAFGFVDVGLRRAYYDNPREDARVMMATLKSNG